MMLNPRAIEQFFARQLENYDWIKGQSSDQLDAELAELIPAPEFGKVKLWTHQKASLLLLLELQRFMLFLDMGGGKTNITLQLVRYRKQCGEQPKAIVFVPYITSVETWVEEAAKHAPDLVCIPLVSSTDANLQVLQGNCADLFVICYQSAVAMLADKTNDKEWTLNPDHVRQVFQGFDTLVMDEVHKCKSIRSLTYRMCRALAAQCTWCLGLTGTPFGRDLQDLWPQFQLIDFGQTLGKTFGVYREAFFTQKINYWGGYEYTFKKRLLPHLKRMIKNASISYTVDEFADMPSKEYIKKYLAAPDDVQGYCNRALRDLKAGQIEKSHTQITSSYLQLRQLASGFMTFKGEDNTKLQVEFEQNPKLEALAELVEAIPPGSKVVIFHHFVYTSKLISDKLRTLKRKHSRIWGGQRDPIGELRNFKEKPEVGILLINWKSGSSSLNLQNANYMIVFEQPESPIDRKQGEARLWRPGQGKRVFIYDLLMRETVDERLHKANEEGRDLLRELLDGKG